MSMLKISAIVLAIAAVTGCTIDDHADTKPVKMVNGKSTNNNQNSNGQNGGNSNNSNINTNQNPHTVSYGVLKQRVEKELRAYAEQKGASFGSLDSYTITAGGKTYTGDIDLKDFGKGLKQFDVVENASVTADGQKFTVTRNNTALLYQQDYSVIAGFIAKNSYIKDANGKTVDLDNDIDEYSVHLAGTPTKTLPSNVKATYVGKAFTADDNYKMITGDLSYTVDFGAKTGSGKITSNSGNVTLNQGSITQDTYTSELDGSKLSGYGISGTASSSQLGSGKYSLGFFGANAEEIAGTAEFANREIGFGGSKQ